MSENEKNGQGSVLDEFGFDLVADLERQSMDSIRKLRAHERLEVRLNIVVRPGNASDMSRFQAKGLTGDLSEGGTRVLLPVPLTPGDIYRVEFDKEQVDLPMVFARCMRCRLVRENTFEAGLAFFNKITLVGMHAK